MPVQVITFPNITSPGNLRHRLSTGAISGSITIVAASGNGAPSRTVFRTPNVTIPPGMEVDDVRLLLQGSLNQPNLSANFAVETPSNGAGFTDSERGTDAGIAAITPAAPQALWQENSLLNLTPSPSLLASFLASGWSNGDAVTVVADAVVTSNARLTVTNARLRITYRARGGGWARGPYWGRTGGWR